MGTIQTIVNLDHVAHNDRPTFGELKMAIAQFFRINGDSTQLRGVTPDIAFPSSGDVDVYGESTYDSPIPWMQVKQADHVSEGNLAEVLPMLRSRHDARIRNEREFQYLVEDFARVNAERKKNQLSLNEASRRKERDELENRLEAREKEKSKNRSVHGDSLQTEAAHILSDEVDPLMADTGLAARVMPHSTYLQGAR